MRTATENTRKAPDMRNSTTEMLVMTTWGEIATEVDKELPDELVSDGQKLEIKSMIDVEVFDIVERPNGKKVIHGRWVLRRRRDSANEGCGQRILCWHTTNLIFQMSTCKNERQTAATFILVRCDTGHVVRVPAC